MYIVFKSYFIFILQISRLEKTAEGTKYRQKLFVSVGNIYVGEDTVPPKRDVVQLISLCGGQVCDWMLFWHPNAFRNTAFMFSVFCTVLLRSNLFKVRFFPTHDAIKISQLCFAVIIVNC